MSNTTSSSVPSLNSFGSILAFAIDLEAALERFYGSASAIDDPNALFSGYAQKSMKRRARLIALRQDSVTEMVLEPISGLDAAAYTIDFTVSTERATAIAEAIRLEGRAEKFYREAGPKLNVTESRRAFTKLAQENGERLTELGTLHG